MLRTRHTLLLGLLLVGVLVPPAVRGQAAADTYRDPLAYTRVAAAKLCAYSSANTRRRELALRGSKHTCMPACG